MGLAPFFRTYEAAQHWRLLQEWGDAVSEEGFAVRAHRYEFFYRSASPHCMPAPATTGTGKIRSVLLRSST
jgi:hypothetical protein